PTLNPETVSVTDELDVASDIEVAVSVTARLPTACAVGALYVTATPLLLLAGSMDPHGAVGQSTAQVTPPPAESLLTVAVICDVPPG
ncbi:MAG: hypothetical protein ACRET4_11910, partial [Steroidobacteraceae bacterium]